MLDCFSAIGNEKECLSSVQDAIDWSLSQEQDLTPSELDLLAGDALYLSRCRNVSGKPQFAAWRKECAGKLQMIANQQPPSAHRSALEQNLSRLFVTCGDTSAAMSAVESASKDLSRCKSWNSPQAATLIGCQLDMVLFLRKSGQEVLIPQLYRDQLKLTSPAAQLATSVVECRSKGDLAGWRASVERIELILNNHPDLCRQLKVQALIAVALYDASQRPERALQLADESDELGAEPGLTVVVRILACWRMHRYDQCCYWSAQQKKLFIKDEHSAIPESYFSRYEEALKKSNRSNELAELERFRAEMSEKNRIVIE